MLTSYITMHTFRRWLLFVCCLSMAFSLFPVLPSIAQTATVNGLLGTYYTGTTLEGTPVTIRLEEQIAMDWGSVPPMQGVVAPFSVRWIGYLIPRYTEEYQLFTTSDDGVRLWVNGQQLINNWSIHVATEDQGQIWLEAGQRYPIVLEYFDRGVEGVIKLEWASRSQQREVIPAAALAAPSGLMGDYFDGLQPVGTPRFSAPIAQLDMTWEDVAPISGVSTPFAARWVGYLRPRYSEEYQLITTSDDGVRLWVDGQQLINNWSIHAATEDRGRIRLEAGRFYPIVVEFFDRGFEGVIKLEWESRSQRRQVIPTEAFFTSQVIAESTVQMSPGLRATYYANQNLSGTPAASQVEGPIDAAWSTGTSPSSGVSAPLSIRWEGFISAPGTGEYTLITTGDDGVRLWVNDRLLIDSWVIRYASEDRAVIRLEAGRLTPIRMEFFDRGYDGLIRLEWQGPSVARTVIPRDNLFHVGRTGGGPPIEIDGEVAVFRPQSYSLEEAAIVNPLRGLYRWRTQETAPQPRSAYDSYERYTWRDLEPSEGRYDFSVIDRDLEQARRNGRKHGFRIRSLVDGQGKLVPDYLVNKMEHGWWANTNGGSSDDTYVPDWNDPNFLEHMGQLIDELGRRYNGDPRISFIDIGFYGNWGEWTMWPLHREPPGNAELIRPETLRFLIDRMARAFPDTQLLMGTEDEVGVEYALRTYPRMGWRRDSLGVPHFSDSGVMRRLRAKPEVWQLLMDRWRAAPIVTEFIGLGAQSDPEVYQLAQQQVLEYKVSMVSNGNTFQWGQISPEGRNAFIQLGKLAGYRLSLYELRINANLAGPLVVETQWQNSGSAPLYEQWQVWLQLRNVKDGQLVYEAPLSIDLGTIMPGGFQLQQDQLQVGNAFPPGSYELSIIVRDPAGYRAPLALSQEGRQLDGSHLLGVLEVE
jgi:hypothetical protein